MTKNALPGHVLRNGQATGGSIHQGDGYCSTRVLIIGSADHRRSRYAGRKKILIAMKLTFFLLTAAFLTVNARSVSQTVTFHGKDTPLEKVFQEVKKQTGYFFFFTEETLAGAKPVSIHADNMPLLQFLDSLFAGQPLEYFIESKTIRVAAGNALPGLLGLAATGPVKGIIKDKQGNPLAGATIRLKGSSHGVSSDNNGQFTIEAKTGDELIITYVGYQTRTIKVNGAVLDLIQLEPLESALHEVVVSTGYWTTAKKKSVGNISKVTAKDIERQPVTSPLLALQGRMPGVEITPTGGTPGAAVSIRIRGENSLRTRWASPVDGNLPLYVVDGVPLSSIPVQSGSGSSSLLGWGIDPLSGIDPANIESIEVLKDADATAIYGSRGANGVVLITTKNRKSQESLRADVNLYRGIGEIAQRMEFLNTAQNLEMRREGVYNDGPDALYYFEDPTFGPLFYPDLKFWKDTTRYTDWQDVIFGGQSNITDAKINLSGGTGRTTFAFGAAYHKETLPTSSAFGFDRITTNLNIGHTSRDQKFQFALSGTYGFNKYNLFENSSFMTSVMTLSPSAPALYNPDGGLNWEIFPDYGIATWDNPMSWLRRTNNSAAYNLISNMLLGYRIAQGLELKTNIGFSRLDHGATLNTPISSQTPGTTEGTSIVVASQRTSWIVEPQLTYDRVSGGHLFNAVVGATLQQAKDASSQFMGTGYTSDALLGTLAGAGAVRNTTSNTSEYRYGAVFARLGYEYKDRYLVNLTGRRDGSSRFGPGRQYGNFGAIGVGWIFTNESFFEKHLSFLSSGKLRASYGSTGNDQIGDSRFVETFSIAPRTYQNNVGLIPTSLFNPEYSWEVTNKLEIGLEAGFFKDRLSFELSRYMNRSSNQLVEYQLPGITGFLGVLSNFGATVENTGWELLVVSRNISTGNFAWTTSFNLSFPRNKLARFEGIESSPYAQTFRVGSPLSIQHEYVWTGVDPTTGLHTFKDFNNDGQIGGEDERFTKALETDYHGGLNNSFSFNGFDLSFFLQFASRQERTFYPFAPGSRGNHPVEVLARWQKPGDITKVQRYSSTFGEGMTTYRQFGQSDGVIDNVSFVRLKTVSLSYNVPGSLSSKIGSEAASVFVQGQNLFTVSNFPGWDPETLYGVPTLRIISFGLQAKF